MCCYGTLKKKENKESEAPRVLDTLRLEQSLLSPSWLDSKPEEANSEEEDLDLSLKVPSAGIFRDMLEVSLGGDKAADIYDGSAEETYRHFLFWLQYETMVASFDLVPSVPSVS
jgi:hypothetical protein